MKIDRLIGIITLLLQRERVTAPELAERFEVSRRTIGRDIEAICRAGIPLVTTQGYGGGISIAEGYRIDHALLTGEELQMIFSGLRGMDSVSRRPHAAALAEKLSVPAADAADPILIDLSSHDHAPLTEKIACIRSAIQNRQLLAFHYCYERGECRRVIEPYRLIFKWSAWYVWGYCLTRRAFRLFKLNRLWQAEAGPEGYVPRSLPELDLDRYFSRADIRLRARFQAGQKHRLIEEYGAGCFQAQPGGELLFEWDFASYSNMRAWILSFGDQVEVLEPAQLRADLRRQAKNLLARYEEPDI